MPFGELGARRRTRRTFWNTPPLNATRSIPVALGQAARPSRPSARATARWNPAATAAGAHPRRRSSHHQPHHGRGYVDLTGHSPSTGNAGPAPKWERGQHLQLDGGLGLVRDGVADSEQ